ncbi:YrbL family protein [Salinimicrobium sp. GXAS 041]|uniref:YrbL family protein n=1 Tax=Salinimicrobium sp. GXAS 041 TaxID=3400806 RepID=UPI003C77856F
MIQIEEKHYIGKGKLQKCFVHPDNDKICLKVNIDQKNPRVNREIFYYKKIQKKFEIPFIAKYYGEKPTNLGVASMYELIRDETTNNISLSLYDYLKMDDSPFSDELFISELEKLKRKMIEHKIFASDLNGSNICCKILKNNSIELIIVDGVGHRDFIPLVEWFHFLAKRKINKIFLKKKLYSMDEHRTWLRRKYSI